MSKTAATGGHRPAYRTSSWALAQNPTLGHALNAPITYRPSWLESGRGAVLVGWGRRPSGQRAATKAAQAGTVAVLIEDGFLRSFGRRDPSLSFVLDDKGIYYDASCPSALEQHISARLSPDEMQRCDAIIARWRAMGLSKYNAQREFAGALPERYVLVVDQVAYDQSIAFGLAGSQSFSTMLAAALEENLDAHVVVKVHPDALQQGKAGHFDLVALQSHPRIRIIAEACHPVRLIERAEAVYAVTSQMGFEGLLRGKRVRCFGMPFYAGWGLTGDELPAPARRSPMPLAQLAYAALVRYPRYLDPEHGYTPCEIETVMDYLAGRRSQFILPGSQAPGR